MSHWTGDYLSGNKIIVKKPVMKIMPDMKAWNNVNVESNSHNTVGDHLLM